jgi:hydrogenase maturation protease
MKHGATDRSPAQQALIAPIVVIGYGNPYRKDDGAGQELATRLVHHWSSHNIEATLLTSIQLLPEMAAEIGKVEVEAVFFIDTESQATTSEIQICPLSLDTTSPSMGHQLDPATLLLYAALLYWRYPRAWLVSIPGVNFDHGEGFSHQVEHLLNDVSTLADRLLNELEGMKDGELCTN